MMATARPSRRRRSLGAAFTFSTIGAIIPSSQFVHSSPAEERSDDLPQIDYLFTRPTATARPGCAEVPGVTLSNRLLTSSIGVAPSWHAERRAPPGEVWLKKGLSHSK